MSGDNDSGWRKRQTRMTEADHIFEALMLRYGSDLQAANVTLLLKDGDKAVRFITIHMPQKQEEQENE
jgi:hypothetical protein